MEAPLLGRLQIECQVRSRTVGGGKRKHRLWAPASGLYLITSVLVFALTGSFREMLITTTTTTTTTAAAVEAVDSSE